MHAHCTQFAQRPACTTATLDEAANIHGSALRRKERASLASVTLMYCAKVWLYTTLLSLLPSEVVYTPALCTPSNKGIAYGLPVATALKLVWLFGIGRDVV